MCAVLSVLAIASASMGTATKRSSSSLSADRQAQGGACGALAGQGGEVGVVMTVNRAKMMKPLLALVLDREKRPLPLKKLLNLELLERSGTSLGIRRILGTNAHGINVRQIIMESQVASALN